MAKRKIKARKKRKGNKKKCTNPKGKGSSSDGDGEHNLKLPLIKELSTIKPELPKLRVLSLFDGIGTGFYALKELNFDVEAFYASEIDEDAIFLTKSHFGDKITHLGSIIDITEETLNDIGPINFLIGGSPCSDLSCINHRRKGLWDTTGTGILFFDYFRIWDELLQSSSNEGRPFYWMFENVANMEIETKDTISDHLRCDPIVIDSYNVSPQKRKRFFWTNIPNISSIQNLNGLDKNEGPELQSCLVPNVGRIANFKKINTITTKRSCLQDGKTKDPVNFNGRNSNLFITEIENIFGLNRHYTDVGNFSVSKRQKLIGKSWSIPTIMLILKLLKNYFATKEINE